MPMIIALIIIYVVFEFFLLCINLYKNDLIDLPEVLIEDQKKEPFSKVRIGLFDTKRSGCGCIACYNLLHILNEKCSYVKIVSTFEMIFGPVLFNTFGINPLSVILFLKLKGFEVSLCSNVSKMDKNADEIGILFYVRRNFGAHYVAFDKKNNKTIIHNPNLKLDSFSDFIRRKEARYALMINVKHKGKSL